MARVNTLQYGASGTLLGAAGTLALVTGFNNSATLRYFQLFDSLAPAPGAVPVQSFIVRPSANFSFAPSAQLAPFGTACTWRVSSTPNTLTAAAENFLVHGEAQSQ